MTPDISVDYTYYNEPKPIVRIIEQNATPTSFEQPGFDIATGSFYEIDYLGKIINTSLKFMENLPLLSIDNEIDDVVDDLINSVYAGAKTVPLK